VLTWFTTPRNAPCMQAYRPRPCGGPLQLVPGPLFTHTRRTALPQMQGLVQGPMFRRARTGVCPKCKAPCFDKQRFLLCTKGAVGFQGKAGD
jgi:hypothetical protein